LVVKCNHFDYSCVVNLTTSAGLSAHYV
jgi:hypothetical protein